MYTTFEIIKWRQNNDPPFIVLQLYKTQMAILCVLRAIFHSKSPIKLCVHIDSEHKTPSTIVIAMCLCHLLCVVILWYKNTYKH